ncbi:MAG: hypothetical protein WC319_09860 [Candidatus Paceibacterota bacterium]|jgi:hypothetical protein|nr:hypothetical protein [Treponema sp.]
MKTAKSKNNSDFSLIFDEIEKFNQKDSSIIENLVTEDELKIDESIREFGKICSEISSNESNTTVFLTFS